MKRIYSIIAAISLLIFMPGCGNDWLDEMKPQDSVETDKAINTDTEAEYAMNGIYSILRCYEYYGARYTYYADATSEDMQARNDTKRVAKYYLFELNAVSSTASFWNYPYKAIRNANNVIAFTERFSESEMSDKLKDIKGQALTIRAMAHFDLVKVYGLPYTKNGGSSLGVPIVIENLPSDATPSRNTVAEVYAQVIKDLEEASRYIGKDKNDVKLNWYGNQLLLARAYLYMDNNAKAYEVSSNLIDAAEKDKNYGLTAAAAFPDMWKGDTSPEYFFMLLNNAEEIEDSKEFVGYLTHRSGYDDLSLSSDYIDLLDEDPDDVRHKIIDKYRPKEYRWYLQKYVSPDYKYSNIPVLRMAEAYLIAAEAAVKLGDNVNALKYLNVIQQRANPEKEITGEVTLERVLTERRKELVGEGHRLYDAMRNNQVIERKGASHNSASLTNETRKFDWNYHKIILAIPKRETNVNPNIIQNEGYGI